MEKLVVGSYGGTVDGSAAPMGLLSEMNAGRVNKPTCGPSQVSSIRGSDVTEEDR
jgi:hypothetical protein